MKALDGRMRISDMLLGRCHDGRMSEGLPDFFSQQVTSSRRFVLDLSPPPSVRLAVVCGGVEDCAPTYRIERRTFPFYCVEFVAAGAGEVRLGRRRSPLLPGIVFSYGPGVPHCITSDPRRTLVKYFADFTGHDALSLLRRSGLPPGAVRRSDRLGRLALEIVLECAASSDDAADLRPYSVARATYERCRRHIEQNWRRLRNVRQAAAECHVDPAHLSRLFRRCDRTTPHRFLVRLRMTHAAGCLRMPDALVKAVAADLGYSDPFHFSRVFLRVFASRRRGSWARSVARRRVGPQGTVDSAAVSGPARGTAGSKIAGRSHRGDGHHQLFPVGHGDDIAGPPQVAPPIRGKRGLQGFVRPTRLSA